MSKLQITQMKSTIGCLQNQIANIEALGLGKIRKVVVHDDTPQIRGMIFKVKHLVEVKEID